MFFFPSVRDKRRRLVQAYKSVSPIGPLQLKSDPDFVTNVQALANLSHYIAALPDEPMVDMCMGNGGSTDGFSILQDESTVSKMLNALGCDVDPGSPACPIIPKGCQMTKYAPYDNCSINTPMGPECARRRPCGHQPGYLGPFEYVNPAPPGGNDSWCGAFKHPSGHSYFPPELEAAVCKWQDLVDPNHAWCRPPMCSTVASNESCQTIEKYGLNNVPTGKIWNEPYPDDQYINHGPCNTGLDQADITAFAANTGGVQVLVAAVAGVAVLLGLTVSFRVWKTSSSGSYRAVMRSPAESILTSEDGQQASMIQSL